MRIGLIDVDGHNFPNIPLMKISAWHKQQGDSVEWYDPLFSGHMDKVYMSKVFSFTPDYQYYVDTDILERGGLDTALKSWMEKRFIVQKKIRICHMKSSIFIQIIASIQTLLKILHMAF